MDRLTDVFNNMEAVCSVLFLGFNNQHSLFLIVIEADRKCCNTTQFYTAGLLRQDFQIIRPDITTLDADDVLAAGSDNEVIIDSIPNITGIQPAIF